MRQPNHRRTRGSATRRVRRRLRAFAGDEDGALIALTLILLIPMLVVGGFAVDLMRYESRRAVLQGVTDQAVLAAANLRQKLDPASVVVDYFDKAGPAATLLAPPQIDPRGASSAVTVSGFVDVEAFFFGQTLGPYTLAGTNLMRATSLSSAIEGVGQTEVSLVLDISGSMNLWVPDTGKRRMELLQTAASGFIDDLLDPTIPDRVSISLVPYTEQVNIGPALFAQVTTDHRHDFSHCLEFEDAAFSQVAFDFSRTYAQTPPLQAMSPLSGDDATVDRPTCPRFDFERITPFSQDAAALKQQIGRLEPRGYTSIFLGLKWGAALLDPSMQPAIAALPDTLRDPAFADRPHAYDVSRNSGRTATLKYLILVTDGENSRSLRPRPEFVDTDSELDYLGRVNLPYALSTRLNGRLSDYVEERHSAWQGVQWMRSICSAAKAKGIQIYTISVTGDDDSSDAEAGRQEMRNCASDPSLFFKSTGANLDSIFEQISKQITDLRLTR